MQPALFDVIRDTAGKQFPVAQDQKRAGRKEAHDAFHCHKEIIRRFADGRFRVRKRGNLLVPEAIAIR